MDHFINYHYSWVLPFEKDLDHKYISKTITQYWHYSIFVSIAYFIVVKAIEVVMEKRKPLQLHGPLTIWNGTLAIFSIIGMVRTGEELLYAVFHDGLYGSVCTPYPLWSVPAHWFLWFAISKVIEFGDTVFLVLRKRPLTFLHIYHHAAVLVYTSHAGSEAIAAGRWYVWMNFTAHSFMYTYYMLVTNSVRVPRRIAQCVTVIQTTQMLAGVAITALIYYFKHHLSLRCRQSDENLRFCLLIYASFAILFIRFFLNTYWFKKQPAKSKKID